MQDEKILNWFNRHGLTPPRHISHDLRVDDISTKLRPLKAHSWRLEGNRLIAKTDMGDVVNYIDPSYVMTGVDDNNLPILKKIG